MPDTTPGPLEGLFFADSIPAAIPDTPPAAAEQPFDPDLPKLFANLAAWWTGLADENKDEAVPVFEFHFPIDGDAPYPNRPNAYVNCWHTITMGDLLQLRARDAFAEKTRLQLAEACADWRGKYEEQHARADHLQALADGRAQTILELGDKLDEAGVEQ